MKFDRKLVHKTTKLVGGSGPATSLAQANALAAELRIQADRAVPLVQEVSGLDVTEQITQTKVYVVDRANWAVGATEAAEQLLRGPRAAEEDVGIRATLDSISMSAAIAIISRRILGQFDPFWIPEFRPGSGVQPRVGRLLLVAPNIQEFRNRYDLDRRDLCLWVSVHELTHAGQFAVAPWLVDYISSRVRGFLESEDERDINEVMALMSLLEGHAQYVMNTVPIRRMPSQKRIVDAMSSRRREDGPLTKRLWDLIGLSEKAKQYAKGDAFVRAIIDERGLDAFNRIWQAPLNAPSLDEIDHPHAWMERVL